MTEQAYGIGLVKAKADKGVKRTTTGATSKQRERELWSNAEKARSEVAFVHLMKYPVCDL